MKNISLSVILILISFVLSAQSNGLSVYNIMQEHCATCHSNGSPAANLDLEGTGSSDAQRWASVYFNIMDVSPQNEAAAAAGDALVYAGRPDKSFLFRKLNNGLEPTLELGNDEGDAMPQNNNSVMTDSEKEIIRQWILFGARLNGTQFDESVVKTYYEDGGVEAFPNGPPAAPAADEGFQIKFGPFFLGEGGQPGDELEFFHKYQLDLPEDTEVTGLDHLFSGSSHHFIVYRYETPAGANNIPDGLRLNSYHDDIKLVTAVQEALRIDLPEGSAFPWKKNDILDLNSHYINYSIGEVYKAEAYLNVYTQDKGTAAQEMKTELIANLGIFIPNNETMVTIDQPIFDDYGLEDIYLWGLMGHTHKYGRDYKVWTRENGIKKDMIYDASCPQAVPECVSPNFDYQHIPFRLYEPFVEIDMTGTNGIIHQASWLNDGPSPVFFGPTSDDEMMVLVMMYLEDIDGVNVGTVSPGLPATQVSVFPNPMSDFTEFVGPNLSSQSDLRIFDGLGKTIYSASSSNAYFRIEQTNLPNGIYFYEMNIDGFAPVSGKLVVQ